MDAFRNFIQSKDASYFESYAEKMAFDQNTSFDENNVDFTRYSEDWLQDRFVNKRGQYVAFLELVNHVNVDSTSLPPYDYAQ